MKRSQIDTALDEIITQEKGVEFQRLAIQLAKKRWPNVIANEIHHDGGEDGTSIFTGIIGEESFAIGCSITGTLLKVKDDCKKIEQRQRKIDYFVFYTPNKISTNKSDEWKFEVKNIYRYDLIVISREDIAESLLDPANDWLAHQYLHIPYDKDDSNRLITARELIKQAAYSEVEKWKSNYLITEGPDISLTITYDSETRRSFNINEVATELLLHRRMVIKGPPGAGKTHSLIRVAEQLLNEPLENNAIPIICSFAEWEAKNVSLASYISSKTSMKACGVTEADIAKLSEAGELVFLLNGWNEVSFNTPHTLIPASLNELTRCSFIITSRERRLNSIFSNYANASLERISFVERKRYVTAAGVHDSATVLSKITADRSLDEITRIPLFLTMLVDLVKDGTEIPINKYEIIKKIIWKIENMAEHQHHISAPPMEGCQTEFLYGLSTMMMQQGIVSVQPKNAIQLITQLDNELSSTGRKAPATANHILDTLSDHHILVLSDGYQFLHQQFQECYAADYLDDQYIQYAQSDDRWTEFKNKVINIPWWQESLLLLADKLSLEQRQEDMANLIRAIFSIDPNFAASIAAKTSGESWVTVKDELGALLRSWYNSTTIHNKECALASMVATGKPDFADIIVPLVKSEDYQVRAGIFRVNNSFELSLLGDNWPDIVTELPGTQKSDLIVELIYLRNTEIIPYIYDHYDSLPVEVKLKVIEALSFRGIIDEDKLTISIKDLATCTGLTIVEGIRKLPSALVQNCTDGMYGLFPKLKDLNHKKSFIANIGKYNDKQHSTLIETELNGQTTSCDGNAEYIAFLIDELIQYEPAKAYSWIKKVFLSGKRVTPDWADHIVSKSPSSDLKQLVDFALNNTNRSYESKLRLEFLVRTDHRPIAEALIAHILVLSQKVNTDPRNQNEDLRDSFHDFRRKIRQISYGLRAEIILCNYGEISDTDSIFTLISILIPPFRVSGHDDDNIDITLPIPVRTDLIALITKCYNIIDPEQNIGPSLLSDCFSIFAAILAQGDDYRLLADWLEKEIERYDRSWEKLELWAKSGRKDKRPNNVNYFNIYIHALERAQGVDAEPMLKRLLQEAMENGGATRALVYINMPVLKKTPLITSKEKEHQSFYCALNNTDSIPPYPKTEKTQELAQLISQSVTTHLDNLQDTNKQGGIIISQVEAVTMLAYLDVELAYPLLLRLLDQNYIEFEIRNAFNVILKNGRRLEAHKVVDYIDKRFKVIENDEWKINDEQYIGLLFDYAGILLYTDKPTLAFPYIEKLFGLDRYSHDFRDLLYALAYSADEEVSAYLFSLKDNEVIKRRFMETWLLAVLSVKKGFLDYEIRYISANPDEFIEASNVYLLTRELASRVAVMANQDSDVWIDIKSQCNSPRSRMHLSLLCQTLSHIKTDERSIASCELLRSEFFNLEVERLFEDLFTDQVPIEGQPNAYNVYPQELNATRKKLFEMSLSDDSAGLIASNILAWLRLDRIEQGWADGETRHPDIETGIPWPLIH